MKWAYVKLIMLRELRDQLRDRRTLFMIAVLPLLLYPVIGMTVLQVAQFWQENASSVFILGADRLPESPALVEGDKFHPDLDSGNSRDSLISITVGTREFETEASMRQAGRNAASKSQYDAVVYFPPGFAEAVANVDAISESQAESSESPQPLVFFNAAKDKSRIARQRVLTKLSRWRTRLIQDTLESSNLPAAATDPFSVASDDVAESRRSRAALWSKVLPFVVMIWALTGAFYPAVDLCAGEKERGTLETLLCSPANRLDIVWGKLLTISIFSFFTALLNLVSIVITGSFVVGQLQRLAGPAAEVQIGRPPLISLVWLVLALVPIATLFSAVSFAVAAMARSTKEGQYYLMPLLLALMPLMMLPVLPAVELDLGSSLIPVTGLMLLLRSLMEGEYVRALTFLAPVAGITGVCCWLASRWAVDQFNNESVLFRESERLDIVGWLRHLVSTRGQTPTVTAAFMCGVLLLVVRFFLMFVLPAPETWNGFATVTVLMQIFGIAVPAVLFAFALTRSPRKALCLKWPRPFAIVAALLLAVLWHPITMLLAHGVHRLYPLNESTIKQLSGLTALMSQAPSPWLLLAIAALAPSICEELAYRGFILTGLRHIGSKWTAILISSVFFGIAHGVLQQSILASLVGCLIGFMAVQAGSIWPGVVFHFVNNSLSLFVLPEIRKLVLQSVEKVPLLASVVKTTDIGIVYAWPVTVLCVAGITALLYWFHSLPYMPTEEEQLRDTLQHQSLQPTETKSEAQPIG